MTTLFFNLSSFVLALTLFVLLFGATGVGLAIGRSQRHRSEHLREPFAALQAALLGMVGLLLAFGLSMAVGRYETRRAAVVDDANAIGATYLRAQTLPEPVRTARSACCGPTPTPASGCRTASRPATPPSAPTPMGSASSASCGRSPGRRSTPRLETARRASTSRQLNEMIDMQTTRVAALNNRVPGAVLLLEVVGAMIALGLLGAYLAVVGRGVLAVLLAARW